MTLFELIYKLSKKKQAAKPVLLKVREDISFKETALMKHAQTVIEKMTGNLDFPFPPGHPKYKEPSFQQLEQEMDGIIDEWNTIQRRKKKKKENTSNGL